MYTNLLLFGLKSKVNLTPKTLPQLSKIVKQFDPASDLTHPLCIKGLENMLDAIKSIGQSQIIKDKLAQVLVTQIDKMTTAIEKSLTPQSVDMKTKAKLPLWKSLLTKLDKQENIKVLFGVEDLTQGSLKGPSSDIESLEADASGTLVSLKHFKTSNTNEYSTKVNCGTIAMEISGDIQFNQKET